MTMIETEQTVLTPEETGAFVAQWAEQHRIGVEELARRLDVPEAQAASLLRQAKGRVAMNRWLDEKQPKSSPLIHKWPMLAVAAVVGAALGAFVTSQFWPSGPAAAGTAPLPLPPPGIQVTTTNPAAPTEQTARPGGSATGIQADNHGPVAAPHPSIHSMAPPMGQLPGGWAMGKVAGPLNGQMRPVGHSDTSGFHPVPAGAMMPDGKPVSVNDQIKAKIPADLIVLVRSSHGAMIVNGETTNNLRLATGIRREAICETVRDLLSCFEAHGLTPTSADPKSAWGKDMQLEIWLGSAHLDQMLTWDSPSGSLLKQSIGNPYSGFYDVSVSNLQQQIRQAGKHLFLFPSRAPEVK